MFSKSARFYDAIYAAADKDYKMEVDIAHQIIQQKKNMNISEAEGSLSILFFHYLVATSEGIEYFTERHKLGLFTHEEYLEPFHKAGLEVSHDPEGLVGRGLYIGLKP